MNAMIEKPTHFATRAVQRAKVSDADALYHDLRLALSDPDRWHEYIELVKRLDDGSKAYRFRIASGIFYAIVRNGIPLTIFTQDQMRSKKHGVKLRRANVTKDAILWRKSR